MGIRLEVERIRLRLQAQVLAARLDRMAGERGAVSFRTPEFLDVETRLGLSLAGLASIEFQAGDVSTGGRAFEQAEQIFVALRRFLPQVELEERDRSTLELRMQRLMAAVTQMAAAA